MVDLAILARIETWVADGLIDELTAARLRAAESARADAPIIRTAPSPVAGATSFTAVFGPGLAIVEMFGYLGAAFLLAAWHTFVLTGASDEGRAARQVFDTLMPAIVFTLLGLWLGRGSARLGRAAGVAFAVATFHIGAAVWLAIDAFAPRAERELVLIVACGATAMAAVAFRRQHPALLTQASLIAALWALAASIVAYAQHAFLSPAVPTGDTYGQPLHDPAVMALAAIATAAAWILVAVGVGVIGLGEAHAARRARDEEAAAAARRRAAITRLGAGMIAVIGVSTGVWLQNGWNEHGSIRAVPAFAGDGVLIVVSLALVWLAIRGRSIYLYPAALGLVIALTDLNAQYVAPEAGAALALLLEGLILLGVGFAADRLRRRMAHAGHAEPSAPPLPPPPAG